MRNTCEEVHLWSSVFLRMEFFISIHKDFRNTFSDEHYLIDTSGLLIGQRLKIGRKWVNKDSVFSIFIRKRPSRDFPLNNRYLKVGRILEK